MLLTTLSPVGCTVDIGADFTLPTMELAKKVVVKFNREASRVLMCESTNTH